MEEKRESGEEKEVPGIKSQQETPVEVEVSTEKESNTDQTSTSGEASQIPEISEITQPPPRDETILSHLPPPQNGSSTKDDGEHSKDKDPLIDDLPSTKEPLLSKIAELKVKLELYPFHKDQFDRLIEDFDETFCKINGPASDKNKDSAMFFFVRHSGRFLTNLERSPLQREIHKTVDIIGSMIGFLAGSLICASLGLLVGSLLHPVVGVIAGIGGALVGGTIGGALSAVLTDWAVNSLMDWIDTSIRHKEMKAHAFFAQVKAHKGENGDQPLDPSVIFSDLIDLAMGGDIDATQFSAQNTEEANEEKISEMLIN